MCVSHSRLRKSSATAGRESTVAAASTGSSASTKASSLTRFQLALVLSLAARLDFQKPLQSAGRPLALPMLQGNDQPETLGDNNRSLLFVKCFCYARFFRFRCEINKGPLAPKTYSWASPPAPQISMLGSLCAMRFYKNGLLFISASLHSTFLRSQH